MNFDALQKRVRRAENVVQARMDDTVGHWGRLDAAWRSAWTPGRIVIAGLAGGFLAGKLEPNGAFSGARWLQMIGSVSGLVASAQASMASLQEAGLAAAFASAAATAGDEDGSDEMAPPPQTRTQIDAPPRAAEAATELQGEDP